MFDAGLDYWYLRIKTPSSGITDSVVPVDFSEAPAWWKALVDTSDGTKARAYRLDTKAEIPLDPGTFTNSPSVQGIGRVKLTRSGASATTILLAAPVSTRASVAAGDTYGQHAVYHSGYQAFWTASSSPSIGLYDRTSNGIDVDSKRGAGTISAVTGPLGPRVELPGGDNALYTDDPAFDSDSSGAMYYWGNSDAGTGEGCRTMNLGGKGVASQFRIGIQDEASNGNFLGKFAQNPSGSAYAQGVGDDVVSLGSDFVLGIQSDGTSSSKKIYLDGVDQTVTYGPADSGEWFGDLSKTGGTRFAIGHLYLNGGWANSSFTADGVFGPLVVRSDNLSDAEWADLYDQLTLSTFYSVSRSLPAAPTGVSAGLVGSGVLISWEEPSAEMDGAVVEVNVNNGGFQQLLQPGPPDYTVAKGVKSYLYAGAVDGDIVQIRVRAVIGTESATWSESEVTSTVQLTIEGGVIVFNGEVIHGEVSSADASSGADFTIYPSGSGTSRAVQSGERVVITHINALLSGSLTGGVYGDADAAGERIAFLGGGESNVDFSSNPHKLKLGEIPRLIASGSGQVDAVFQGYILRV